LVARRTVALLAVWTAVGLACACRGALGEQNHTPWTAESVLRQLDLQSRDFHSLSANVERTKVTVVVDDHSTSSGTILVHGDKVLLEMKPPDARTVLKAGDSLYVYTPGLKRVEEYNLGKNRSMVDEFLLLGFGTSGRQLKSGYQVSLVGEPALDDKRTVELELVPKSQAARDQFSKIEIWFDESTWLPVQQQLYETGSGDYTIVRFSNLVRNPPIQDSQFKPHWPKGTEKIKPRG
jgi:outer membrane lipoprotein-sorting protein